MEGSSVPHSSESLEDRIRRMALSNTVGQQSMDLTSQPVVRLPPTSPHGSQQPNLLSTVYYQGQGDHSPDQMGNHLANRHPAYPVGHHGASQFPPHRSMGHSHQYAQPSAHAMHQRQTVPPLEHLADEPYSQSRSMPGRGNHSASGRPFPSRGRGGKRHYQQVQVDPDAYRRVPHTEGSYVQARPPQTLYDPLQPRYQDRPNWRDIRAKQAQYLDNIAAAEVPLVEMSEAERSDKENFRRTLEAICLEVCNANPQRLPQVSLECFGSFQSGFASTGSDMDLVIVAKDRESESTCFSLLADDLPRALEQRLLYKGFGARLLTRTRVPIIKVCQNPGVSLLDKLRQEREKWDFLPNEKKYPHLYPEENDAGEAELQGEPDNDQENDPNAVTVNETRGRASPDTPTVSVGTGQKVRASDPDSVPDHSIVADPTNDGPQQASKSKSWTRERRAGPLDFPKTGVGIQSDINFFNPLGLHNTQMLRCYSLCDHRVRPMILFVKSWAKRRQINSSYSGTLSSYGYVLMVLHYLVNVVRPPVLPNLQHPWRPDAGCTPQGSSRTEVDGWTVDFWRNESEIINAALSNRLTTNTESIGSLLVGFFQYYSSLGGGYQFRWTMQILSLRTPRGILTKEEKGWTKATMEQGEGKKVQHRYLFCIEDPFELNHNVARTVTHHGIVAIRDEFRRAYNILNAVANGAHPGPEDLFDRLAEKPASPEPPADSQGGAEDGQQLRFNAEQPARPQHSSKGKPPHPKHAQLQSPHVMSPKGNKGTQTASAKSLDVTDNNAFPVLGAFKPNTRKKPKSSPGEISGDRAKALLEEINKKRAQAKAEATASGAIEAALDTAE